MIIIYREVLYIAMVSIFSIALGFLFASPAEAVTWSGGPISVHGYAWSDNIGWISFNCDQTPSGGSNTCGTINYGVELNTSGSVIATLSGFAWSDNIGWIKFDGLNSFPNATNGNPEIVSSGPPNYEIEGWVRACAGTAPGDCSNMNDHSSGWDGWISLNCNNTADCGTSDYKLTVNTGSIDGFAWGSDVVGWLQMINVTFSPPYTPQWYRCENNPPDPIEQGVRYDQWQIDDAYDVCAIGDVCSDLTFRCVTPIVPVVNDFSVSPEVVRQEETVTISWDVNDANNCKITSTAGDTINDTESPVGSGNVSGSGSSVALANQTEFTLSCVPSDLTPEVDLETIEVNVIPIPIEI